MLDILCRLVPDWEAGFVWSEIMENETLSVVDNRTGKSYTLPLFKRNVRAMDLRQIKTGPEDFGVMSYDPAFMNTASCQSSITFIDGDKGILRYRGYPILDKHIVNGLREMGVINKRLKPTTRKGYLAIEKKLARFADEIGIDMDHLDLLLWSRKTGEILK